jgi:alpha-ketoglutarate-dependent taurine dioxygenase
VDPRRAAVVPRRAASAAEARALVGEEGAAIVSGIADEEAAIAFARAMLGEDLRRVGRQIEASRSAAARDGAIARAQPADDRGRRRDLSADTTVPMPPHNDGFAFGDEAPDRLLLLQVRPARTGGENFLLDGLALLGEVPADLRRFAWSVPVDHSEPGFPQATPSPIARTTPGNRVQVRHHEFLAPARGAAEVDQWPFLEAWHAAVDTARDGGARFRLEAGEMAVVDNYRMLHGRHGYDDPQRLLYSIWGWTTDAVAVPSGDLDFVGV